MARPRLEIDPVEVRKLAEMGCKMEEIADFFGCSIDTLGRRFADEMTKGRANLKISLRRTQIKHALNGNVALLIWLGKQMLGQVERSQIDITRIDDETFMKEAQRRIDAPQEQSGTEQLLNQEEI